MIAHSAVSVRHSVIGRRVLIAHVLTGTGHPGRLKAEKNILREHLGNVRLSALARGRDRDRETVRALVKGHASEQGPHQVDVLAVKGAALVIARHAVIARKEVTVLGEAIVHHVARRRTKFWRSPATP